MHKQKYCDSHPIYKGNDQFPDQAANVTYGNHGERGVPTLKYQKLGPETRKEQELRFEGWDRTEKMFGYGCFLALSQVVRTSCRRQRDRLKESTDTNSFFNTQHTLSQLPIIRPFMWTNTFFSLTFFPQFPSCTWLVSCYLTFLSANTAFSLTTLFFIAQLISFIFALLLVLPHFPHYSSFLFPFCLRFMRQ